jgi:hypothetical protein
VVVTDNPAVLHASNIHFGQYGLLVPVLRDPAALAIQAAEWACGQVGAWYGLSIHDIMYISSIYKKYV